MTRFWKTYRVCFFAFGLFFFMAAGVSVACAQNSSDVVDRVSLLDNVEYHGTLTRRIPVDPEKSGMSSLFFTPRTHMLIKEFRRGGLGDMTLGDDMQGAEAAKKRDLSLGGILYKSAKAWTIWLNGQRITPDAIPGQIMYLKVHEDFVEMKWYDAYTRQIFPVRLRPHQRFNLDTRLFLPGVASSD